MIAVLTTDGPLGGVDTLTGTPRQVLREADRIARIFGGSAQLDVGGRRWEWSRAAGWRVPLTVDEALRRVHQQALRAMQVRRCACRQENGHDR